MSDGRSSMAEDAAPMTERQLREMCRGLLAELAVRGQPEPHELCRRLAQHRGRAIVLEAQRVPGVDGCGFGALLPLPDKDIIVYPADVSPPWQAHIIFHEVIHLVLNHAGDGHLLCGSDSELAAEARQAGSGAYYQRSEEWEAETGASILAEIAGRPTVPVQSERRDLSAAEKAYARAIGGRFRA